MTKDRYFSFVCFIFGIFFIQLAKLKEAPNTYALMTGVANISIKIDTNAVAGYNIDVFNPRMKRLFKCLGSFLENVSEEFNGKIKLSGNYKEGTVSFSVLNTTKEDAGIYKCVTEMKSEEVGRQRLIVFAQFQAPEISTTKTVNDRGESGLKFMCHVKTNGTPPEQHIPVFYKWKRNGNPVEKSDKYEFQTSSLIVKNLQRSDLADKFTCSAENDFGAKSPESKTLHNYEYSILDNENCGMSCINGDCSDVGGQFKCICNPGWTGFNCSTDINKCSSNPCHRGTCINHQSGEYLCVCIPGWTGKQCELAIDACSTRPCLNGRCEPKLNNSDYYDCVCKEGWSGTNCNIDASLKSYTHGAIGAGCAIIAVLLLIFGIWYRTYKSRNEKMNEEEVYHDVKRVQSGDYCSIDDEQIYDIRRRTKSNVLVDVNNTSPSDDYPCLESEKSTETLQTATCGYLNPAYTEKLKVVLESKNATINSQNSSDAENAKPNDNSL